ncbi:MAG TPA: DUF998 domain-containing protein [Euzebyales bacterium]|nr:DUF998 domain-containing protein [Euzebyales bacterium]
MVRGAVHDLVSVLVFGGLPAACFVFARWFSRSGQRPWAAYSTATGVFFVVGVVLASLAFGQIESLVASGGLFQRVTLTVGWTWLTLLAVHVLQTTQQDFQQSADHGVG